MVLAFHALNLQTSRNSDNWPCLTTITGTLINQVLVNYPRASYLTKKLNNHNINSIEQFLNSTNSEFLNWNSFHHNIKKILRGKCPCWFTIIQDLIAATS